MAEINFEVIIDEPFKGIEDKDNLFSKLIINNFEDGKWNYKRFIRYIIKNLFLTALSAEDLEAYINDEDFDSITRNSLKSLRKFTSEDDSGNGGEIAEIILYGIMKDKFKAAVATPKIHYKQNSGLYAYGADSCHITIDEDNFNLWLGEAKMFPEFTSKRMDTVVDSILNTLQKSAIEKENKIITSLRDLEINLKSINKENLYLKIKSILSGDTSIDEIKKILCIPILIAYECSDTKSVTSISENYKNNLRDSAKKYSNRLFKKLSKRQEVYGFDTIKFHLILFPIVDKDKTVKLYFKNIEKMEITDEI